MRKSVSVDAKALQEFREAVFRRHGRLHGRFFEEAGKALRHRAKTLNEEASVLGR